MACIGLLKRCGLLLGESQKVGDGMPLHELSLVFVSPPGSVTLHINVHHTILYYALEVVQYFMVECCACRPCRCRPRIMLLTAVGSPACQKACVLGCIQPKQHQKTGNLQVQKPLEHLSLFDLVDLSAVVFSWLRMPSFCLVP